MSPIARQERMRRNFTNTSNRYDAKRERLVMCARELGEQGNAAKVSVTDVTSAMGITRGLFYYYFGGKEELNAAILDTYLEDLRKLVYQDTYEEDRVAQVKRLVGCVYDWLYDEGGNQLPMWHVLTETGLRETAWSLAVDMLADYVIDAGLLAKSGKTFEEQVRAHAHFVAAGILGECLFCPKVPHELVSGATCAALRYRKHR